MPHRSIRVALLAVLLAVVGVVAGSLVTVAAPAAAQAPVRYLDEVFTGVTVTEGIPYGAAPDEHGEEQVLLLDLYEPTGDTAPARPTVVLAHGGSFVTGDRSAMGSIAAEYARRGYVAVSITYRMDEDAGSIRYPPDEHDRERILAAAHDMKAAVRWVRSQATARRLHPDKVAVDGYSAGAVMAVVVATTSDDPGDSGNPGWSSQVCTAVSRAGAGDPAFVGPGDAGALFFHGDADTIVPYFQAVATYDAMVAAGLPARMVTRPGEGHFVRSSVAESAAWLRETMVDRTGTCAAPDPAHPPFVRAAFADFLDRAPTATELTRETGRLDAGHRRSDLLTRLTRSEEWVGTVVRRFYVDTLGRQPDAAGLSYWVDVIRSGRRTVAQVAASFHAAPESYDRRGGTDGGWVDALYATLLGRAPDAAGRAYWAEQTAARGRTWVATRFYGSLESRRDRVTALYEHLLGRAPEPDGLAFWAERVATAGDLALARSLAASAEYGARAVARFP